MLDVAAHGDFPAAGRSRGRRGRSPPVVVRCRAGGDGPCWADEHAGHPMMYLPSHFAADEPRTVDLLATLGAADLVTVTSVGMLASYIPFLYDPTIGDRGALLGHLSRSNDQWRTPAIGDALVIAHGPDAYVSPSWYPSKVEHGRVVPTWDYTVVHASGRLVVRDDPDWLAVLVRRLTDTHEARSPRPWSVDDAPARFIEAQLRSIVGVEVVIDRLEAKTKWSQNRPAADVAGVLDGLETTGRVAAADALRAANP